MPLATILTTFSFPDIGPLARTNDVVIASSAFVIMGDNKKDIDEARGRARTQIAFYASTRTYQPVLDVHGWGDVCLRLHEKTVKGDWAGMATEITER